MENVDISITEEAHARLGALRRGKESFSQVINRLTQKKRFSDYAGILSEESARRLEVHVGEVRAGFKRDFAKRVKDLTGKEMRM